MHMNRDKRVNALSDAQAVAACDAMVLLMGKRLMGTKNPETDLADYETLFKAAGPAEKELHAYLDSDEASDVEVAGAARAMLLLASDMGFTEQVDAALAEGETHVRDFGLVSVPLVLGALACVLAWVPVEQRKTVYRKGEEEVTEIYTRRVGAEAVKAFSSWVKNFVPSGAQ